MSVFAEGGIISPLSVVPSQYNHIEQRTHNNLTNYYDSKMLNTSSFERNQFLSFLFFRPNPILLNSCKKILLTSLSLMNQDDKGFVPYFFPAPYALQ